MGENADPSWGFAPMAYSADWCGFFIVESTNNFDGYNGFGGGPDEGQQSAPAKRSAAHHPSASLTPHHPKSKKIKKIRTNPRCRLSGQSPDPDPRFKKIKPHPKKTNRISHS